MNIRLATTLQEMHTFHSEWADLFSAASHKSIYNHPDFCLNWIDHFGDFSVPDAIPRAVDEMPSSSVRLMLLIVRNNGRLDLILPFRVHRSQLLSNSSRTPINRTRLWSLDGLLNAHNDHESLLVRQGSEAFGRKMVGDLFKASGCQLMNLGLCPDSDIQGASEKHPGLSVLSRKNQHLIRSLSFDGSFADHIASRKGLAKKIRKAKRLLEGDLGSMSLEWWQGGDAFVKGLPAYVDIDSKSWKATRNEGEALQDSPHSFSYYRELTRRFAQQGAAHVWQLRFGDTPVAATLCYEVEGILYQYKTSFDQSFGNKSGRRPGFMLDAAFIESAWPYFRGIDFMSDTFHQEWRCDTYQVSSHTGISINPFDWFRTGDRTQLLINKYNSDTDLPPVEKYGIAYWLVETGGYVYHYDKSLLERVSCIAGLI